MYELIQAGARTYYIDCPSRIGVYKLSDDEVCLIDSGNSKDTGRKVRKILDENGWKLKCIINTHSHADHIGGNKYLQSQTGCTIFAKGIEADFSNHPILEPMFLYGANPIKELRSRFLMASESKVFDIAHEEFPKELEVIPLPGHSFEMIGIRTPDNVVFVADCVSGETALEKYQVFFTYDVAQHIETLELVKNMEAELFVPSHVEPAKDLSGIIDVNINKVMEIADKITQCCETPAVFEDILKRVFDEFELVMTFEQYVLVGSTVRSYLTMLKEMGKVTAEFKDNRLMWTKV